MSKSTQDRFGIELQFPNQLVNCQGERNDDHSRSFLGDTDVVRCGVGSNYSDLVAVELANARDLRIDGTLNVSSIRTSSINRLSVRLEEQGQARSRVASF